MAHGKSVWSERGMLVGAVIGARVVVRSAGLRVGGAGTVGNSVGWGDGMGDDDGNGTGDVGGDKPDNDVGFGL